jgi:hypothetical protein
MLRLGRGRAARILMILPLLRPNILDRNLHSPAEEDTAAIFVRHRKRAIGRRREFDLLKTSLKILSGGLKVPAGRDSSGMKCYIRSWTNVNIGSNRQCLSLSRAAMMPRGLPRGAAREGSKSAIATKKCMIGGFILGEFFGPHIGQHGEDDQKIDDNQGVVGIEPEEGLS